MGTKADTQIALTSGRKHYVKNQTIKEKLLTTGKSVVKVIGQLKGGQTLWGFVKYIVSEFGLVRFGDKLEGSGASSLGSLFIFP